MSVIEDLKFFKLLNRKHDFEMFINTRRKFTYRWYNIWREKDPLFVHVH